MVEQVDLEPFPVVAGKNLTITASGIVKRTINPGAYVNVEVRLGYIRLLKQTFDLCEESEKELGIKCPIEKGPIVVKKEVEIPGFVPGGLITVKADVFNDDEEGITCLMGGIQFR